MADKQNKDTQEPEVNPVRKFLEGITGPWTKKNLLSWTYLILIILFLKGCVVDQYSIPSASMEPTLHGDPKFMFGDRVLVNKWHYGIRVPFTNTYLKYLNEPKRWDIVVFRNPNPDAEHKILIKRLIGLSGETISFDKGKLVVDGEVQEFPEGMPENMFYADKDYTLLGASQAKNEREHKGWMQMHDQLKYGMATEPANIEKFNKIPEGHFMMCGDNTLQSFDSRYYGWVPKENLYGRSFGIWWPIPRRADFTGFSSTWWGNALMFGIPLLIVLSEIWAYRSNKKKTAQAENPES